MAVEKLYDQKLFEFTVLWEGWECDSRGWVARKDGKKVVILTNHGQEYIAGASDLQARMLAYRAAIAETETALAMVKEK